MSTLRVGVARNRISPPLGIYLIGYGDRMSGARGIHDELTVTAVVFDDEATRLAVIALDMLCLNEHVVERIRERIAVRGIPPAHTLIAASHTHAAPIAYADEQSSPMRQEFINTLVNQTVETVEEAMEQRAPSQLVWGTTQAPIALNRREHLPNGHIVIGVNPDGFVDRDLYVLQCQNAEGYPQATLVNFACHAVVLGPDNLLVSADWPSAMRRRVEPASGAPCLFLQGAAGDLNPRHKWGDDNMSAVEALGAEVAVSVLNCLSSPLTSLRSTPLRGVSERLWLDVVPSSRAENGGTDNYQEVLAALYDISPSQVDALLNARYPWRSVVRQTAEGRNQIAMEIQALCIGECGIVAHAAETFNELGATIKQQSPFELTLVSGYSNGCIGYLPTAEAHAAGGYEVEFAPYVYRVSGLLAPDSGEIAVKRSVKLLRKLSADTPW